MWSRCMYGMNLLYCVWVSVLLMPCLYSTAEYLTSEECYSSLHTDTISTAGWCGTGQTQGYSTILLHPCLTFTTSISIELK